MIVKNNFMTMDKSTFSPLFHIFPQGYATLWINSAQTGKVSTAFAAQIRSHSEPVLFPGVEIPRMKGTRERQALPPAFMRGEGRAAAGGVPRRSGKASSVTASPCQLSQRESQGRCAPFLPPAFMRGEGRAVAGGVSPPQRESLLSHGFAVPALPKGEPRALRAVPAPSLLLFSQTAL